MENMRQLFEGLKEAGVNVHRPDDYPNCFTILGDEHSMSVSFTEGNYCENRFDDWGWAAMTAEVLIWRNTFPFPTVVDAPKSGVWQWQNSDEILGLIDKYLGFPDKGSASPS